jgi:hypothetical protein
MARTTWLVGAEGLQRPGGNSLYLEGDRFMSLTASMASGATQALRQSPHPALRQLCVEETESSIVISGRVSSYYLKQLAQETLMPLRGERELLNRVTVVRT